MVKNQSQYTDGPQQSKPSTSRDRFKRSSRRRRRLGFESLEARRVLALFLEIPGIDGGAVGAGSKATSINVAAFEWNFQRPDLASPPLVSNLSFVKDIDQATPDLITDALIGPLYATGTKLRLSRFLEGKSQDVVTFGLTNAQLTSFNADDSLTEIGSLSFSKIDFTEQLELDGNGVPVPGVQTASWNLLNGSVSKSAIDTPTQTITDQTVLTIGGKDLIIDDFEWDASIDVQAVGGKIQKGVADGHDFVITRPADKATAGILGSAAAGTVFSQIKLTDRKLVGSTNQVFLEWTLHDAFISSFQIEGNGESAPTTKFSLNYSKIDVSFTPFDSKGKAQTPLVTNWDELTGKVSGAADFGSTISPDTVDGDVAFFGASAVGFKGQLEYEEIDWSASNNIQLNGSNNFGTFGTLQVTAPVGPSTPALINALAGFRTSDNVTINDPNARDFWELNNAFITGYRIDSKGAGEPIVVFDITFAKAANRYTEVNNGITTITSAGYNQLNQTSFNPAQSASPAVLDFGQSVVDTDLELHIVENGQTSEISLNAVGWEINRAISFTSGPSFGELELGLFQIAAARGLYSPGFFLATARGDKIDQVSVHRYETINTKRVESYRWELSDVFFTNYTTELLPGAQVETSFVDLRPSKIALVSNKVDSEGNLLGTATRGYDDVSKGGFNSNTGTPPNAIGSKLGPAVFPRVRFDDDSNNELILDQNAWGATLSVSNPNSAGVRTIGKADATDFQLVSESLPSFGLFERVLSRLPFGEVTVFAALNNQATGAEADEVQWKLGGSFVSGYRYSDSAGSSLPTNEYLLASPRIELATSKLSVLQTRINWNLGPGSGSPSLTGNFGDFQFPSNQIPETILEIVGGNKVSQAAVANFNWLATNFVDQEVGTLAAPTQLAKRGTATQQSFDISAELGFTAPGFINAVASGVKLPDLKIVQRRNIPFVGGDSQYLPYREWILTDAFIESINTDATQSDPEGTVRLRLNAGRITSRFIKYDGALGTLGSLDGPGPSSDSPNAIPLAPPITLQTDPANTSFTNFVDFITPPVSLGIGSSLQSSTSIRTIPLASFFTDEQEAPATLKYSFSVLGGSGLFDSTSINAANQLVLDFKAGQSGIATIRVDAMDSFDLVGSDTFQVAVDVAVDFGDAPAPLPTLLANNGAGHIAIGPRLGSLRDTEVNGLPNATATGDGGDEDGVMFGNLATNYTLAGINITVANAAAAKVDAWIDFNRDGDWDDIGEKILDDIAVVAGLQTLNYTVPAGLTTGNTIARVRLSSTGGLAPTGFAVDGEVEDYAVAISAADLVAPTIATVFATNTNASPGFIDAIDGGGIGAGSGVGYALTSGQVIPNAGINRLVVQFSEPIVGFNSSNVSLLGINVASYNSVISLSYDATNNRGIINLSVPIFNDRLRVRVTDMVKDFAGTSLDGDGVGGAGGMFEFAFNILVGDANRDGSVNGADLPLFGSSFNTSAGQGTYNPAADFGADGSVNGGDLPLFAARFNQSLPS